MTHHQRLEELILSKRGLLTAAGLTTFYLLLIHVPSFRCALASGLWLAWRGLLTVLLDVPRAFFELAPVTWFLHSRPYLVFVRFIIKPLPLGLLVWLILIGFNGDTTLAAAGAGLAFVTGALLLNTRLGRDLEDAVFDRVVYNWEFFRGLLPGLFRLLTNVFRSILEAIDRFFYAVDEWLRFRADDGRFKLAAKTVAGLGWFVVSYVVRLYVNVFIEPTINPIKHFPVVTVAAKLLVPFWITLLPLFGAPFQFLGRPLAFVLANVILHSLPGAAGFLVWELKANWRLYRANRPRELPVDVIGHHGETMLRLMKPGFHSGTLPKLYAKLRRAERRAYRGGSWKAARRLRENLHDVADSVRHFTEREFVAYLRSESLAGGARQRWLCRSRLQSHSHRACLRQRRKARTQF